MRKKTHRHIHAHIMSQEKHDLHRRRKVAIKELEKKVQSRGRENIQKRKRALGSGWDQIRWEFAIFLHHLDGLRIQTISTCEMRERGKEDVREKGN